jgi:hypothetical protein
MFHTWRLLEKMRRRRKNRTEVKHEPDPLAVTHGGLQKMKHQNIVMRTQKY